MSERKVSNTMKMTGGGEYAKVPERLKLFREDCPNGLIETKPTMQPDGSMMFQTRVLKDKSNPSSAEATGTAFYNAIEMKKAKAFEKLETISVGRALALLGYLASGEVASSEEMDEFLANKETERQAYIQEQVDAFGDAKTMEELKELWAVTNKTEPKILAAKDKRKLELEAMESKS